MRELIHLVAQVRENTHDLPDDEFKLMMPSIIVVGAESTGKSSILESIVGIEFLPRGADIVTKWPLQIQLIRSNIEKPKATFSHLEDKPFFDFNLVKNEIENRTKELLGESNSVVSKEIHLKIESEDVPDLVLIDLPGLRSVGHKGLDPQIWKDIEDLVMSYIYNENTIILAVSAGHTPLSTSRALEFATKVDPDHNRTFGVLTHMDIETDQTINAINWIKGGDYSHKLGDIGVIWRKGSDKKSIKQAKDDEQALFSSMPDLKDFKEKQGIDALSYKLNILLCNKVKEQLPSIEKLFKAKLNKEKKILMNLGIDISMETNEEIQEFITKTIENYWNSFKDLINGKGQKLAGNKYSYGTIIYQEFKRFADKEIETLNAFNDLSYEVMLNEILKCYGHHPGLFIPEQACHNLIAQIVQKFKDPSVRWWDRVYKLLNKFAWSNELFSPELISRHNLHNFITENMNNLLRNNYKELLSIIEKEIKSKKNYIDYDHHDFKIMKEFITPREVIHPATEFTTTDLLTLHKYIGIDTSCFSVTEVNNSIDESVRKAKEIKDALPKNEENKVEQRSEDDLWDYYDFEDTIDISGGIDPINRNRLITMKRVINSYFSILKKSFKSLVPEKISTFLIQDTEDQISDFMLNSIYKNKNLKDLIAEDEEIVCKRRRAEKYIVRLTNSLDEIQKVSKHKVFDN